MGPVLHQQIFTRSYSLHSSYKYLYNDQLFAVLQQRHKLDIVTKLVPVRLRSGPLSICYLTYQCV